MTLMISSLRVRRRVGSDFRLPRASARQRPAAFVAQVETFYHVVMMMIVVWMTLSAPINGGSIVVVVIVVIDGLVQPGRTIEQRTVQDVL